MAGLYIHIPFCESKCIYCDFYSMANNNHLIDKYIDALLVEAALRKNELNSETITTAYLGGGTPSLLSITQLSKLVNGLKKVFDFSDLEEFTIEVNPDDVTAYYIQQAKSLGINRVSMGVQSFNDEDLRFMNRRHTAKQATDAIHIIKEAGINNISIDLIYGIPGQNIEIWKNNVDTAISLSVQHISAYTLMYEEGTRLSVMRSLGKITEVDDDVVAVMYDYLVAQLKSNGYTHYEISNFALPGFHSRHNSSYWNLTPYLGLGVAAHSFDGTVRRYNPSNLKKYLDALGEGELCVEVEKITKAERYDEYVMLRLRTADGIDADEFMHRFGEEYYQFFIEKAKPLVSEGSIIKENGRYYIPENHIMISDNITCDLLWDD
ncbi:MAG: radical SAM family heme chaperone HemW [Sodaliphilus sp.]|nr:radical SAM family heme chaperone HemW [Sodaliphilus sp.]